MTMNKNLFIIEGIDGSGKTTQMELLEQKLLGAGIPYKRVKFPNYGDDSSALVKMYLEGQFGTDPMDVSAYAASSFYAVDRYASYKKFWGDDYNSGKVVISDRYVSSNILHQSSKLPEGEFSEFCEWLYDFEYGKLGLPQPTAIFFLDVPPSVSVRQVESRYNGDETKKDIHEKNLEYLWKCYNAGVKACETVPDFIRIPCVKDDKIRSKEEISDIIFGNIVKCMDK